VARFARTRWRPELAVDWEAAYDCAARAVIASASWVGAGPAWWPAEVIDHDRAADDITILTVRPARRLPYRPGQAIPMCTPRRPDRWRWYSPVNAPRPDGTMELHVRAVAGGSVSEALVGAVRPGERLWLGPPFGTGLLPPHPGSGRDLLLIAGGTGLAPLRALTEQVAETNGRRRVTLVVGARTLTDLYDPITLDKLQTAHDWLTIRPALSHDPTAPPDERGTAVTIALRPACPDHDVYVCGPPPMIRHALPRLLTAGIPANRIHLPDTFDRSDCPL
jgi:NAD(P)H-flavin reductase